MRLTIQYIYNSNSLCEVGEYDSRWGSAKRGEKKGLFEKLDQLSCGGKGGAGNFGNRLWGVWEKFGSCDRAFRGLLGLVPAGSGSWPERGIEVRGNLPGFPVDS